MGETLNGYPLFVLQAGQEVAWYLGTITNQVLPNPVALWPGIKAEVQHADRPYRARLNFIPAFQAPVLVPEGHAVHALRRNGVRGGLEPGPNLPAQQPRVKKTRMAAAQKAGGGKRKREDRVKRTRMAAAQKAGGGKRKREE
jgi:hypothetical protein